MNMLTFDMIEMLTMSRWQETVSQIWGKLPATHGKLTG